MEDIASKIVPADTAFLLISTGMVMFMTPGLALFYGGMVRAKNVVGTVTQSMICLGVVSIQWVLFGYSLSFGGQDNPAIGDFSMAFLRGVGMEANGTVPHTAFMAFQMMFAVITPALITGAFAERFKFKTFLVFVLLWSFLVYDPLCHWVWGGGWLGPNGVNALDFAGGTVVHISSAAAALACVLAIRRRKDFGQAVVMPHNLPLTLLGAGVLWFGWFGFNAGSALAANGTAANAFVTTHIAAAGAAVSWMIVEWLHRETPTSLGVASGAVAGLVAITPGAGFVTPMSALFIGLAAGAICYSGLLIKGRFKYDDSLDVVAVHGLGGLWGCLATGLFASIGAKGLFYGNPAQFLKQALAAGVAIGYSFIVTFLILKALDALMGLRLTERQEEEGLDISQHDEMAYGGGT